MPRTLLACGMSENLCAGRRTANLPVMTIRVDDAPDAPTVLLADCINLFRAGFKSVPENRIRIGHGKDDAHRRSAQRLGAEVEVLRRFVSDPELGALYGKPRHNAAAAVESINFDRAKCLLVKLHCFGAVSHRKPGRNRWGKWICQ